MYYSLRWNVWMSYAVLFHHAQTRGGRNSAYLQEDIGRPLLPDLDALIHRYAGLITCVCLMGEGRSFRE